MCIIIESVQMLFTQKKILISSCKLVQLASWHIF